MDDTVGGFEHLDIQQFDEEPTKCVLCEKALGVVGLVIGAVFLFISIDILTGGAISSMISGGRDE